jgi:hypothetical protein
VAVNSKENELKKKLFIIGSNARLAKAIINHYQSFELVLPPRSIYESWGNKEKEEEIFNYFQPKLAKNSLIFIASGILNSTDNNEVINSVNLQLPWNVILALNGLDVQIITFGTILEKLRLTNNNYVRSKIELSDRISELKENLPKVTHFRLHTLYGYGLPSPFMFLGQIYEAIKNKSKFNMSSGFQIREYHHLDDVAYAVDRLIRSNILGISEVTAGKGIQLRDLASTVFKAFNLEHLIKIGSIEIKHKEKLSNDYKINPNLSCSNFRNPTEGVVAYLKGII